MEADVRKISDQLYLITLNPPISGFSDFITIWLYKGSPSFVIDVGLSVTSSQLIKVFDSLEIDSLDYIFLTHIHLDHAGGIGELAQFFPDTPIICHSAGIPHLVDPTRLWEGTVKTLGDLGRAYGPVKPVPKDRLVAAETFSSDTIFPLLTLGHSPHHMSYQFEEYMFAGETGGVFIKQPDDSYYLRPATPPRFFLETSLKSIDLLIEREFTYLCFGHFGISSDAKEVLKQQKDQLFRWHGIINDEFKNFGNKDFYTTCLNRLIKDDPLLSNLSLMDAAVREREYNFLTNSIKGFALSLKAAADNS